MSSNRMGYLYGAVLVAVAALMPVRAMAIGSIIVSDAWARALTVQDGTAIVYLTITDIAGPDKLIGVSSPISAGADLRETQIVDGVVQATPLSNLPVTPDEPTELLPGGKQVILLIGMQKRLQEGKQFPLTLTFEKAGPIETSVLVRSADYVDPIASMK